MGRALRSRELEFTRRCRWTGLAAAAGVVGAITALLVPVSRLDPGVSSGVLYVLGVLLLTTRCGLRLGLVASGASAVALGAFHGDLSNTGDLVAIGNLLLTATVASFIADRARARAEEAEERLVLQEELRRIEAERIRLREVRKSRARVIAAADDERRRLVRDLHDGAQQRLVNTLVSLALARQALDRREAEADADADADAATLVDEALAHARGANDDLRELAHGIHPAVLTQRGLRGGVQELASRMSLPVTVDVLAERLPPSIEAPAYFIVAEALTNVTKHARAQSASVTAAVQDGVLRIVVRDDGAGGAQAHGNGLLGLGDRVAALDGTLEIDSPLGGGTRIEVTVPVGPRRADRPPQVFAPRR